VSTRECASPQAIFTAYELMPFICCGESTKYYVVSSFFFCFRDVIGWPSWPPYPLPQLYTKPSLIASVCNPPQATKSKVLPSPANIPPSVCPHMKSVWFNKTAVCSLPQLIWNWSLLLSIYIRFKQTVYLRYIGYSLWVPSCPEWFYPQPKIPSSVR